MKRKILKFFLLVLCLAVAFSVSVSALTPSYSSTKSYELDTDGDTINVPVGYVGDGAFGNASFGLEMPISAPEDFCYKNGYFYILDSGNGRVVKINSDMKAVNTIDSVKKENESLTFTGAQGIAVDDEDNIYIADTENYRILKVNQKGKLITEIVRPDEALKGNELPFRACKIQVSNKGEIYTTVDGINLGIFVFSSDGAFSKFVGSTPIVTTANVLYYYALRIIMTPEQIRNRMQNTPLKVHNFCIDDERFVYTVSQNDTTILQSGMVRYLNYNGSNVLDSSVVYGDLKPGENWDVKTAFAAVETDGNGNIFLLDQGRKKVFYYSDRGKIMTVFGGAGSQTGTFEQPVDIVHNNGDLYVLDKGRNAIYKFVSTEYMKTLIKAANSLKLRDLENSLDLWKEVQRLNSNSLYSYYGMGLAYQLDGEYQSAMKCFKMADDKENYSEAFGEYRNQLLKKYGGFIVAGIAVLLVIIILTAILIKKNMRKAADKADGAYSALENKWLLPIYCLRHPVDGFEQFRNRKLFFMPLAAGIVLFWMTIAIIKSYLTAYIYNPVDINSYNPLSTVLSTVGLFLIFVVSNWCIASFIEGKGTFPHIFCMTAYALIPYILMELICVPLSYIFTADEAIFITIIKAIGVIWSAAIIYLGTYAIHQFSAGKTVGSLILTAVGMIIILFVLIMIYTLLQQAFGFVHSIYIEATL